MPYWSASGNCSLSRVKRAASVSPVQVLHDQEVGAVLIPDIEQRADVRVRQRGDSSCLALEALPRGKISGQVRRKDFDGDGALKPCVSGLVDLTHPPCADEGKDLVRPEGRACLERHLFRAIIRSRRPD